MTTDNLCHRLRTLLGGELGNEAADEIERLEHENAEHRRARVFPYTIEFVGEWLETQGLTAVSKADAERLTQQKESEGT
jgi:hypothetical protein